MDQIADALVSFVDSMSFDVLPPRTIHQVRRRLVDSIGCALGALAAPPAVAARDLASTVTSSAMPASVLGADEPSTVEMAAFANTVMVRYLDYNDAAASSGLGHGHPSDTVPAALAMAEALGKTGAELTTAIVIGYEVQMSLENVIRPRNHGLDQGLTTVVATAMSSGKLLGLSRSQLRSAVGIALVPHVPLRQTRTGELSMWKGCATAAAARNGVFAALLAQRGVTGPDLPFAGRAGLLDLLGRSFELELEPPPRTAEYLVERTGMKSFPADNEAQAPIALMLRLRDSVDVSRVRRISVQTYFIGLDAIARDPERWDPQTRESADHSLPYLLAVALVDGAVTPASFRPERVLDPTLRPLMSCITVTENPEYTRRYPAQYVTTISIELGDGQCISATTTRQPGGANDPLTDAEIDAKFATVVNSCTSDPAALLDLRAQLWRVDEMGELQTVLARLRSARAR